MDSNEEAALVVMTLATFTGSIKCKKRRRRKEWIKPWFQRRQHIPETFCFLISCHQFLFYFIFFFFFNFFEFFFFFSTKSKLFFYFYITWNLLYIIWKIWGMLISNFWLVKNTCSIIFCEKVIWLIRKVEHCATF